MSTAAQFCFGRELTGLRGSLKSVKRGWKHLKGRWKRLGGAGRASGELGGPQGELGGPPGLPEEMVLFFCCVLCYFTFVGMSQR